MLLQQEFDLSCPYCGETISVLVDDSSGPQSYYEDCPVCCAPILFIIDEDESGDISIVAKRDDE